MADSEDRMRRGPPWWASVVLGAALAVTATMAGFTTRALVAHEVDSRATHADQAAQIATLRRDVDGLRGDQRGIPTRAEFERLANEVAGLRADVQRLTEAFLGGRRR